jgi:hypothetical protein
VAQSSVPTPISHGPGEHVSRQEEDEEMQGESKESHRPPVDNVGSKDNGSDATAVGGEQQVMPISGEHDEGDHNAGPGEQPEGA